MTANRCTDPGKYQTGVAVGSERVPPSDPQEVGSALPAPRPSITTCSGKLRRRPGPPRNCGSATNPSRSPALPLAGPLSPQSPGRPAGAPAQPDHPELVVGSTRPNLVLTCAPHLGGPPPGQAPRCPGISSCPISLHSLQPSCPASSGPIDPTIPSQCLCTPLP